MKGKRKGAGGWDGRSLYLRWTAEDERWVSERRPEASIAQHNPAIIHAGQAPKVSTGISWLQGWTPYVELTPEGGGTKRGGTGALATQNADDPHPVVCTTANAETRALKNGHPLPVWA